MEVRVFRTARAAARSLAAHVASAVTANPHAVLGLPAGRTPIPLYAEIVSLYRQRRIDLSGVTTFNLDEFAGIDPADPRSYRAFMRRHLFDHVNVPRDRIHSLKGRGDSLRECARYERSIERAGGIDLLILGLGRNGHVGFNEPGRELDCRTHRVRLADATRRANLAGFGRLRAVPREGLTMGLATIALSREIALLVTGRAKAKVVSRLRKGSLTTAMPATLLHLHPNVTLWLDAAAAPRRLAPRR